MGDKKEEEPQPKQKKDETDQKPKLDDQKVNEASASTNGKEMVFDDDDEQEELSESEKLMRKKKDRELDNVFNIRQELEAQEAIQKIMKVTLETQKSLFPPWFVQLIQNEAIDNPSVYWLEPTILFNLNNGPDSRLNFPITPQAFFISMF